MSDFSRAQLSQELKRDEGVRARRYQDHLGFWTIGVGHLLHGQTDPLWDKVLNDVDIETILQQDIDTVLRWMSLEPAYRAADSDARRRALINMGFQLGHNGFDEFRNSQKDIILHNWRNAGARLRLSKWYKQTPERAERVIRMLENG
jgi:lysozyme